MPQEDLAEEALKFLNTHQDRLEIIKSPNVSSARKLGPSTTEGDVVAATLLHLWSPIEDALEPFQWQASDLTTYSEKTENDVRGDLQLALRIGNTNKVVAIIEFKNRGHVKTSKGDFSDARLDPSNAEGELKRRLKGKTTLLANNARTLSCQATVYAREYNTPYVAVFDWDSMFLWNFTGLEAARSNDSSSQGHFAGKTGLGCYCDDPQRMPVVLLGFLLQALKAAGAKEKPST